MAIVSNNVLVDAIQRCNLLPAQQLGEALALVDRHDGDVAAASKALIEHGCFTSYQVNLLAAGRGDELVLGPYSIIERLSKSARCEVYKAKHVESDCIVALKVFRTENLPTPAAVNQFFMSIHAFAELDHPNAVQFYDADQVGDAYYCAMELVEGSNLDALVRQEGRLSPTLAAEYVRQAALGLQCAHEHNLVHRDIKPVNLILIGPTEDTKPQIKILDWSLATVKSPAATPKESALKASAHSLVGTADYLSPEQAMNPEDADIRSDIYSLGCTLYFLLTAQTPFTGASVMQKALQHLSAEAEPVENLNPEVPRGLAGIVRRMMAKQAKERVQTPAAVALALSAFCRSNLVATVSLRRPALV
jgi:serine/threonine protein kinase